jgi:hypothetical protein
MAVTAFITWQQGPLTAWLSARMGRAVEVTEYMIYPAVVASIACLVVVSLLTAPPPEEKWRAFVE